VREEGTAVLITQRGRSATVLMNAEDYFDVMERLSHLEEMEIQAACVYTARIAHTMGMGSTVSPLTYTRSDWM